MNSDLHEFVRDALARGVDRERIREALVRAHWTADEIAAALEAWDDAGLGIPVPRRRIQLSAREAFLYLVMFATLYVVAYNTGAILFAAIERQFPDPAATDTTWDAMRATVRFGVASLLVAFPVFLWTSRILGRAMAKDPEKRGSGIRRWLTYLTLFNAACVLIGDFIVVVLGMLNGELSSRFLLKGLVVAAIAGSLFVHYLGGLRRDEGEAPAAGARPAGPGWIPVWLPRLSGLVVLAVMLLGMIVAGSPNRVRREQLDQRRVRELAELAGQVRNYRLVHDRLPSALSELSGLDMPGVPRRTRDPVTREPYEYAVTDSLTFTLCAVFEAPDSTGPWGRDVDDFWRHGAGRACFTFTAPSRR